MKNKKTFILLCIISMTTVVYAGMGKHKSHSMKMEKSTDGSEGMMKKHMKEMQAHLSSMQKTIHKMHSSKKNEEKLNLRNKHVAEMKTQMNSMAKMMEMMSMKMKPMGKMKMDKMKMKPMSNMPEMKNMMGEMKDMMSKMETMMTNSLDMEKCVGNKCTQHKH